jgi:hypothetical protein
LPFHSVWQQRRNFDLQNTLKRLEFDLEDYQPPEIGGHGEL